MWNESYPKMLMKTMLVGCIYTELWLASPPNRTSYTLKLVCLYGNFPVLRYKPDLDRVVLRSREGGLAPGADLGIFVCQSKMTSHFCNDRFHFFFGGGGSVGMVRRKIFWNVPAFWGHFGAKYWSTKWHFFTTYLINNYFSPNEIRLSFCILFYFNKVWENIDVVVL